MAYRSTSFSTRVLVLNDKVDLGAGFSLPQGEYEADCIMWHIPMRGRTVDQLASVKVELTEQFLQSIGMPPAKGNLHSVAFDVTRYVLSGDIKEAP